MSSLKSTAAQEQAARDPFSKLVKGRLQVCCTTAYMLKVLSPYAGLLESLAD